MHCSISPTGGPGMARGCAAPELSELFARHVPRHGRDLSRTCMGLKLESPGEIDPMPNQNVPTMIKVWFDKRNIREDSEAIAKEGALNWLLGTCSLSFNGNPRAMTQLLSWGFLLLGGPFISFKHQYLTVWICMDCMVIHLFTKKSHSWIFLVSGSISPQCSTLID